MMKRWLVGAGIATVVVLAALPVAVSASRSAQTVSVSLSEFRIKGVPAKLKPGAVTFKVKNAGKFPHNFQTVFGPVHWKTAMLKPGSSATVSTNLKPGAYIIVCSVGDGYHASQGMIVRFTVGTFDFKTFKWHA
jgi:uncharacterized cupredoxin-like copper-binding protein